MTGDEVKEIIVKKYPDSVVEYYKEYGLYGNENREFILFTLQKKNSEIKTMLLAWVHQPGKKDENLDDLIQLLTSKIKEEKFHYGILAYLIGSEPGSHSNIYTLEFASKYICRVYSEDVGDKELWGYGCLECINAVEPFYEAANEFKCGLAAVKLNGKWGYINDQGKVVVPFKYEMAGKFSNDFGYGDITYEFKNEWSEKVFSSPPKMRQAFAAVKDNGKWGYINRQGETVIPFLYEDAGRFSEEYAHVKLDGKWGYVNAYGKEVIQFLYEDAKPIMGLGVAPVKLNGKWGLASVKTHQLYIPTTYDAIVPLKNAKYALVQSGDKWGYIDYKELIYDKYKNRVTDLIYDSLEDALLYDYFSEKAVNEI